MTEFICPACHTPAPGAGQCMECRKRKRYVKLVAYDGSAVLAMSDVRGADLARLSIPGFPGIENAMAGGFVPGSATLLYGGPGLGKTRLALLLAERVGRLTSAPPLYVSSEQMPGHVKLTAGLVGVADSRMLVSYQTQAERVADLFASLSPAFAVVDSVQGLMGKDVGLVAAVRVLIQAARRHRVALLCLSHATKEDDYSGPRTLEHDVDAMVELTRDTEIEYLLLWTVVAKYRFGPIGRVARIIQTQEGGLRDGTTADQG